MYGPLAELDLDAAGKIIEVEMLAGLRWTELAWRAWTGAHGGSVVNLRAE